MATSLCLLPIELQLCTFFNLRFRDVLTCRALSKHFCALIDSNKELAFTIELGAAGVRDDTNSLLPREDKFETLWQLNVAWANLHWLCRRQIQLSGTGKLFDISGDFFFRAIESIDETRVTATTVEWFRLPSRRQPNLVSTPERLTFDVALVDFAMDAHRDLVIGIEVTNFRTGRLYTVSCNLYAKSISTNKVHPASARSVLFYRFVSPITEFEPLVEICGNHVGILLTREAHVTHRDAFDMFLLVDWTTGVFKATMSSHANGETWQTFCFVTPDSVVIPSTYDSLLNIFHFDNTADSLKHDVSLLLPEPVVCNGLRHINLRGQPFATASTLASHPTGDIPSFTPDAEEAVIILSLDYQFLSPGRTRTTERAYNIQQVVAIPRRLLARYASLAREGNLELMALIERAHCREHTTVIFEVKATGGGSEALCEHERMHMNNRGHHRNKRFPHVHAGQWVHQTRWGVDSVTPSMGMYAYGSRYIAMSSRAFLPDAPASSIALYDFNLRNERRGYAHDLEEENIRPYPKPDEPFNEDEDWDYDELTGNKRWPVCPSKIVTHPTTVFIPEVFKEPFTTALPYRVTETEMVLPWDSAILDGERIIGLDFEDFNDGTIREIDVIVV
ncbi:hypothetical protein ACEPAF_6692 [Sanghuangporus sanghuang]